MTLFEGLFSEIVLDADRRPRRLYPLRRWRRSPSLRAELPLSVYRRICARSRRLWKRGGARFLPAPVRTPFDLSVLIWALVPVILIVNLVRRGGLGAHPIYVLPLLVFLLLVVAAVESRLPRGVFRPLIRKLLGPRPVGDADNLAAAMIACGRCASCAHELDLREPAALTLICPECGSRWDAPVRTPAPASESSPPPAPALRS